MTVERETFWVTHWIVGMTMELGETFWNNKVEYCSVVSQNEITTLLVNHQEYTEEERKFNEQSELLPSAQSTYNSVHYFLFNIKNKYVEKKRMKKPIIEWSGNSGFKCQKTLK